MLGQAWNVPRHGECAGAANVQVRRWRHQTWRWRCRTCDGGGRGGAGGSCSLQRAGSRSPCSSPSPVSQLCQVCSHAVIRCINRAADESWRDKPALLAGQASTVAHRAAQAQSAFGLDVTSSHSLSLRSKLHESIINAWLLLHRKCNAASTGSGGGASVHPALGGRPACCSA